MPESHGQEIVAQEVGCRASSEDQVISSRTLQLKQSDSVIDRTGGKTNGDSPIWHPDSGVGLTQTRI